MDMSGLGLSQEHKAAELAVRVACFFVTGLSRCASFLHSLFGDVAFEALIASVLFGSSGFLYFWSKSKGPLKKGIARLLAVGFIVLGLAVSVLDGDGSHNPVGYQVLSPSDPIPSMPPLLREGEGLKTDGPWFKDRDGRVLLLRGVNLAGTAKIPTVPDGSTYINDPAFWTDHRNVSFVGRPFPLEEADEHLSRLRAWGLTFLRFLVTWEAVEHAGPGLYDMEYVEYLVAVVRKAHEYGIVVFIDPHQDVWSRWTGGDGCPGWVMEKVGFNLTALEASGAAVTHQAHGDPLPKMIWGSNNWRLATATMFTLFFAGDEYAPKTMIDGKPVQQFLQDTYISAMMVIANAMKDEPNVVGFDTLNEPNHGWVGRKHLASCTDGLAFRWGWNFSPWDQIRVGSGYGPEGGLPVDLYNPPFVFQRTDVINPERVSAWRSDGPGCVWRQNGVWDVDEATGEAILLKPAHLWLDESVKGNYVDAFVVPFWRKFETSLRATMTNQPAGSPAIVFAEPPIDFSDPSSHPIPTMGVEGNDRSGPPLTNYVYAPHWYEIVILLTKSFRSWIGLGEYEWDWTLSRFTGLPKPLGVVGPLLGRQACIGGYAATVKHLRHVGDSMDDGRGVPTLIGETGIPFDLDGKKGFRTNDLSTHVTALDNVMQAMDYALVSFTLWNYTPQNTNERGDLWNDEDLSLYSTDQKDPNSDDPIYNGGRALAAAVRPYARKISGVPLAMHFDVDSRVFTFTYETGLNPDAPTELFVPQYQYPEGLTVTFVKPTGHASAEPVQAPTYDVFMAQQTIQVRVRTSSQ